MKTYRFNIGKMLLDMKSGKKSLPDPPCSDCSGACCTQQGSIAIMITADEQQHYLTNSEGNILMQNGRCIYLQDDFRCAIYSRRPKICRDFNCIWSDLLLPQQRLVAAGKPEMIPESNESKGEKRERLKHQQTLKKIKLQRFNGDVQSAVKTYRQYRLRHG